MTEYIETYESDGNIKKFRTRAHGTLGRQEADAVAITGGTIGVDVTILEDVAEGLTAAGSAQGDAYEIAAKINVFGTVASGTGAVLPALVAGQEIIVQNNGANALLVYPASGGTIRGESEDGAISIAAGGEWVRLVGGASVWNYFMGAADPT